MASRFVDQGAPATDVASFEVLDELTQREPLGWRPEFGTTRTDFERLLADEFWETGASGRRYDRQAAISILEQFHSLAQPIVWETSQFSCQMIASETYLLSYTLQQEDRITRRVTIWRRRNAGWQAVYHQGTLVSDS